MRFKSSSIFILLLPFHTFLSTDFHRMLPRAANASGGIQFRLSHITPPCGVLECCEINSRLKYSPDAYLKSWGDPKDGCPIIQVGFCTYPTYPGIHEAVPSNKASCCASAGDKGTVYVSQEPKVIYQSKDGKDQRTFEPLEWLAAMCSHVPKPIRSRFMMGGV